MFAKRNVLALMLAMFVGALLSAVVPEPTAAQGCGWCEDRGTGMGCHAEEDWGGCHIACGPEGEPTALLDAVGEIRTLLDAGEAALAAAVVLIDRADLTVTYQPAGGRINFTLSCDPTALAATVAVLPGVREAFEEALAARSRAAALGPRADRILVMPL